MMTAAEALTDVGAVLLDFDGPVCSVFARYPAPQVANELRAYLATKGLNFSNEAAAATDPLEVLRWAATTYPGIVTEIDDVMCTAERKAIHGASPTPYAHDAIFAAKSTGRTIAIVSNNSELAITDYLAAHHLTSHVTFIAGRPHGVPERMKPHPDSVERALRHLGIAPTSCVFVGDSVTDIQVSRLTGVRPIGYANTPIRQSSLIAAGAEVVISSMQELAHALATTHTG